MLIAIRKYKFESSYPELDKAQKAAQNLAEILVKGGYCHAHPELLDGGSNMAVGDALTKWVDGIEDGDTIVIYWTGHGKSDSDGHFLITENSPPSGLTGFNAVRASELGSVVAKSAADKVLILLDTCYSGTGAKDVFNTVATVLAARPERPGRCLAYAVIASAHPLKKAQEGIFSQALAEVLSLPPQPEWGWTDNDQYLNPSAIAVAIAKLKKLDPYFSAHGYDQCFFPNPRFRGELPAQDVETGRRRLAEDHFLQASRGIEVGELGWYFVGRKRLMTELVTWLNTAKHGLVVVTGSAGSGKSAVVGRVATLSDPALRAAAERAEALAGVPEKSLPPKGIVDVAAHLKDKTLLDCIGAVASGLDIGLAERDRDNPATLVQKVGGLGRRVTLLFDALDEAHPGYPDTIGRHLVRPLSALPQVRVLVGTRRSPDGAVIPEDQPRHGRLRLLFGESVRVLDLDDEPETANDIAEYVRLRLAGSRHRSDQAGIRRSAAAVATKANGIFLYARIVARTLQDLDRLDVDLPANARGAFVEDLIRRFGEQAEKVNELLAALAWVQGKGLTRAVWAPIATALSHRGQRYNDRDVAWVLAHAGWYIIEAGEDGQAVYRLVHQVFTDHYREDIDPQEAHARITAALTAGISSKDWLNSDGYLRRHLASHAAAARRLDALITDPGYLAVADPSGLLPELATVADPRAREIAYVYRLIAHELLKMKPVERMALIHLTAWQEAPALAATLEPAVATAWRCRWAKCNRSSPHLVLGRHEFVVRAVDIGEVDGTPMVVSGGGDGTIRLWDARSGAVKGPPMSGSKVVVTAAALGKVDGVPVVVSAGEEHGGFAPVQLWDVHNATTMGEPLLYGLSTTAQAVALKEIEGVPVVAVTELRGPVVRLCDVRTRTWREIPRHVVQAPAPDDVYANLKPGMTEHEVCARLGSARATTELGAGKRILTWILPASGDLFPPQFDALFVNGKLERYNKGLLQPGGASVVLGQLDDIPVVISGGLEDTIGIWDARTLALRTAFKCQKGGGSVVTLGEVDGHPVVATGGFDGIVQLWDARSGTPKGPPLAGHRGLVTAVAMREVDGVPVVVSGGADSTVRLWDARSGTSFCGPLIGHQAPVRAVAVGNADGRPVVVSGSDDGTLRLWDVRDSASRNHLPADHRYNFDSVALGLVDGTPVVVTGEADGTVQLWDAHSGAAKGERLTGHEGFVAGVALGEVDGTPVVTSGGKDGTVRLWDARSGEAKGQPLTGHDGVVMAMGLGKVDDVPVVVSGGKDGTVRLWDARNVAPVDIPPFSHGKPVRAVALAKVGGVPMVVSGGYDGAVVLWDARTGKPRSVFIGHQGEVETVAIYETASASVVVSGARDSTMRLWDARRDRPYVAGSRGLTAHWAVVFDPDAKVAPMELGMLLPPSPTSSDHPLLWTVGLGEVTDMPVIVIGKTGQPVRLWDARTGMLRGESLADARHVSWVWSGVNIQGMSGVRKAQAGIIVPNGKGKYRIKFGEYLENFRFAKDNQLLLESAELLSGHDQDWVSNIAVGALGEAPVVVSGGEDGTVRLWAANPPWLLQSVPQRYRIKDLAVGKDSEVAVCTSAGLLMLDFYPATKEFR
jgi:WD40 repeat protein